MEKVPFLKEIGRMGMKKLIVIKLTLVVLIIGCATGEIVKRDVHEGMAKDVLISKLGRSDGFKRVDGYEMLSYTNRVISGWGMDRTDYYFVFKNDRLVEWGTGEVRPHRTNTGVILFVPVY